MPSRSDRYQQAVNEARAAFLNAGGPAQRFLETLHEEYALMLIRIVEEGVAGIITPERAEQLSASIIRMMRRLETTLAQAFDVARDAAFEASISGHESGIGAVSSTAGIRVSASFADIPELTARLMMIRRGLGQAITFKTLTNRHVSAAAAEVDRLLFSAVNRGQSVLRTTKELATVLAQNDPKLLDLLSKVGPRGGRTRAAIEEGFQIADEDIAKLKSLLYDSRRISQTELNNALQESDTMASMRSPVIEALKWLLSPLHTVPDECDILAAQDFYGLGPGVYRPEAYPSAPHPFDNCRSKKIIRNPALWETPRPPFGPPDFESALRKGPPGRILGSRAKAGKRRPPTDGAIVRSQKHAREAVERAYRVYQDHDLQKVLTQAALSTA